MRIKKMYQGNLPENKILNTESTSQTDTYSCDYINNLNTGGTGGTCNCKEEVVLYYDEAGTNGEVTLNDSVANYECIEIYKCNAAKKYCSSYKVYNANNKGVDMDLIVTSDINNIYIQTCRANIVGNKITPASYGTNWWKIASQSITVDSTTNSIYIYRVVGYR